MLSNNVSWTVGSFIKMPMSEVGNNKLPALSNDVLRSFRQFHEQRVVPSHPKHFRRLQPLGLVAVVVGMQRNRHE
jgi:hypothetical protein